MDFALTKEQEQNLINNTNLPSQEVRKQAQNINKDISFFNDSTSQAPQTPQSTPQAPAQEQALPKEALQKDPSQEAGAHAPQEQQAQAPQFIYQPTGIAYFDNKMAQGKGFSFIDSYIANKFLGIDLRAHINANINANVKSDAKIRNMTSFYKSVTSDMEALNAIGDSINSNLKSIDGIAGGLANAAHLHLGVDRDKEAKDAMTKLELAKDKIANSVKLPNTTGKETRERVSTSVDSATSHHYNKRDGLLSYYDHILNNLNSKLKVMAEAGDYERANALAQNINIYKKQLEDFQKENNKSQNRAKFSASAFDKKGNIYKLWNENKARIINLDTPYDDRQEKIQE